MDFLVMSHLRWDFVYQRPQHLLSRCALDHRVIFWEEPEYHDGNESWIKAEPRDENITVAVPQLPHGLTTEENFSLQRELLHEYMQEHKVRDFALWYYTPMAINFTDGLQPKCVIYDCMDELSAFRGAPPGLAQAEARLFAAADLVFTGGQSLYESKRQKHHSAHCFPSSIDVSHFSQAREIKNDPADQAEIAHPRIGFCGVIDERMDLELLRKVAAARPEWQFVMIGPVVKISEEDLPRAENIHYLGPKSYKELPAYIGGWDVGMLPFAINESTRFISPTKTPEYLAAGCPVVSTRITDVVRPYGTLGLVSIVCNADEFVNEVEVLLAKRTREEEAARLSRVDAFLARSSWDKTWAEMLKLVLAVARGASPVHVSPPAAENALVE